MECWLDVVLKNNKASIFKFLFCPGTVLGTRCHEIPAIVGVLAEFYKSVSSEEWWVNNAVFQSKAACSSDSSSALSGSWAAFSITPLAKASGD